MTISFVINPAKRASNLGIIAEAGTQEELMTLKREYAKLYNIQASAFFG